MNTTSSTYLVFINAEGGKEIISIESILHNGWPIDSESGDDWDLESDNLVDCDGEPI